MADRFKILTRGPRKGLRVRKSRADYLKELREENEAKEKELLRQIEEDRNKPKPKPKIRDTIVGALSFFGVIAFLCGVWVLVSYSGSYLTRHKLGWVFWSWLVIDIAGDRLYRPPRRPHKYFPFFWIFR